MTTQYSKISELPPFIGTPPGSSLFEMVSGSASWKVTALQVAGSNPADLPPGGFSGEGLIKASSANYDAIWAPLPGIGTITSVGLSLPNIFSVTNSPITTFGTLTGSLTVQSPNTVFAGAASGTSTPTFRALVAADIPASAIVLAVGTSVITGGSTGQILYDNSGLLGEYLTSGTGLSIAKTVSPAFITPSLGTATGSALSLSGAQTILSGTAIPAGGSSGQGYKATTSSNFGLFFGSGVPTLSANQGSLYLRSDGQPYYNTNGTAGWSTTGSAASLTVGSTTISGGATTRILYDNAGVLGEYTLTGGGTVVAMQNSPSFITPALGTATGSSLALSGPLTVTGAASLGTVTIGGATAVGSNSITAAQQIYVLAGNGASRGIALGALNVGDVSVGSDIQIAWTSTTNPAGTEDLILRRASAATLQFGASDSAVAVAQTLRVQSVVAGTAAANGANWTLIGSLPTGTGTSGDIIFQTGVKTGSGTTQGTATTALTIKGETQTVNMTGSAAVAGQFSIGNAGVQFIAPSTGVLTLLNNAGTDFSRLQLGGTTSSFPAIKRNAAAINFRLADDSADASITSLNSFVNASGGFYFTGRSQINSNADGDFTFLNAAGNAFGKLQFGGTSSSFPAIKRNSATLNFRLADDSADAAITALTGSFSSTLSSGTNGGTGGQLSLLGSTSGSATIKVAAAAGTTNFQLPVGNGTSGYLLQTDGSGNTSWVAAAGGGTVTTVSVVSANGLAGSVANPTTTPAITLNTSISGTLQGNGTAISASKLTLTQPGTASTLTILDGKTFTANNTLTVTATDGSTLAVGVGGTLSGSSSNAIFYDNIPQNSQSTSYTTILTDGQKHLYHPGADTTARTWTIASNASVPYPIGTAISFLNDTSAGTLTIAINSDTLVLAGTGSTGSRTLAPNGIATSLKMTSTRWLISGTGLT